MRWSRWLTAVLMLACMTVHATSVSESSAPVYKKKYAMGTVFEILAYGSSPEHASTVIERAFREILRLDEVMSNYKPDSDLGRLNRSTHFQAQTVPPDLYRVIDESLKYSRLSNGKFDITVGPLVDFWKAVMRGERQPALAQERKLQRCVGYKNIVLFPPDRVEFRSACLQIDLGAIGKGYAVDRAVEVLRSNGISRALINAGGSTIYGMGSPPKGAAWTVRLRDPSAQINPEVKLHGNSVSTSEQSSLSLLENKPAGHIVDPARGTPVRTSFTVSVVAKTATASDALSTTLLLMGADKGRELIKGLAGTSAIWISPKGVIMTSFNGPRILFGSDLAQGGSQTAVHPKKSTALLH